MDENNGIGSSEADRFVNFLVRTSDLPLDKQVKEPLGR
jgi:hypothetical protein